MASALDFNIAQGKVAARESAKETNLDDEGSRIKQSQTQASLDVRKRLEERKTLLRDIPAPIIRKAWFSLSHLLLEEGSLVADIGMGHGKMIYTMAALRPDLKFIGVDQNEDFVSNAEESLKLPNLAFRHERANSAMFPNNSLDAIVNSFMLHEVYSHAKYSDKAVKNILEQQFNFLKIDGMMFIRDFAMPNPDEYVLLEMPDKPSYGDGFLTMSDPDLLIWFSEHARKKQKDHCTGFFLEELSPRYPNTRLFRCPHKWAYEFILRKDSRSEWDSELPKEYTFFTERDYRKTLRSFNARVLYTAPHWDDFYVKQNFENRFNLLHDETSELLGTPATSFVAVAQKVGPNRSLRLHERKASRSEQGRLKITAVRNEKSGNVTDIISRGIEVSEVIPYHIDEESGRLFVYLNTSLARGLVNAVPRHGRQLDGKKWSGHMIEAVTVETAITDNIYKSENQHDLYTFSKEYLGLIPTLDAKLENGPDYYPDPTHIDERVKTYFLRVENTNNEKLTPVHKRIDHTAFSFNAHVKPIDAQYILNAIEVGMLPSSRLETQLQKLFRAHGIVYENWGACSLQLGKIDQYDTVVNEKDLLEGYTKKDQRYKDVKGTMGQFRICRSMFVDEANEEDGGINNLTADELEFAVSSEDTINTAVVVPLVKNISGEVLCGVIREYHPVPQKYRNNGEMMDLPCFRLPKSVKHLDHARMYVADQLKIPVECVVRLGESFFSHIGVSPHKVYPFAVTRPAKGSSGFSRGATDFAPTKCLYNMNKPDYVDSFIKIVSRCYNYMCQDNDMSVKWDFETHLEDSVKAPISLNADSLSMSSEAYAGYNGIYNSSSRGMSDESSSSGGKTTSTRSNEDSEKERKPNISQPK